MSRKKRVLVIEEDQAVSDMIAGILAKRGHEVYTEPHYKKGVEMADKILPDLIFISLLLNTANGLRLSKEIHASEKLKNVPVIMIISRKGELDPKYTRSIGIVEVIMKPVNEDEIISKTSLILGTSVVMSTDDAEIAGTLVEKKERVFEYGFDSETDSAEYETTAEAYDAELIREQENCKTTHNGFFYPARGRRKGRKIIAAVLTAVTVLGAGSYFGFARITGKIIEVTSSPAVERPIEEVIDEIYKSPGMASAASSPEVIEVKAAIPDSSAYEESSGEGYSTQIGFFGNKGNAEALVSKMKEKGYDAFIKERETFEGKLSYRVLVGDFESRREAMEFAEMMQANEGIGAVPFRN
jgi:CheY-like chemotaxis protein